MARKTKCIKFGSGNVHFIKDNLFPTPPVFKAIQEASKTEWKEMYKVFNMGHRMEVYCDPNDAEQIIAVANSFNIDAQVIGRTEQSESGNRLTLHHRNEMFEYQS